MPYRAGRIRKDNRGLSQRDGRLLQDYQEELYCEELRVLETESIKANAGNRKVLLIGGAGYIGSVVAEHLLTCGYKVRCLDLLLYDNHCCVLLLMSKKGYEFVHGDFVNALVIDKSLQECTDVVILGGLVGDPITKKYPAESRRINHVGTQNLIGLLNGRRLNKVIFVSTCSNYGLLPPDEVAAEDYELNPLSLYAKSKVAMEKALLGAKDVVDYYPTVLRFATAFGLAPRMRFDLTVNEFVREMYLRNELLVYDPESWRPYCHVKDFAEVIRRVIEAPVARIAFEVFNVGGDINNATKTMLVTKILRRLPHAPITYQERGPDPRNYKVDFKKIRTRLHFEPKYSIDDGIDEIIVALNQGIFDHIDSNKSFYGNYEIKYPI